MASFKRILVGVDFEPPSLGTRGRRGLVHALLGSVAEKTIRTAKRPVVVVHAPS